MDKDKWIYINKIRAYKEDNTCILYELLDKYEKYGLNDITYDEAKEFWNELIEREGEKEL